MRRGLSARGRARLADVGPSDVAASRADATMPVPGSRRRPFRGDGEQHAVAGEAGRGCRSRWKVGLTGSEPPDPVAIDRARLKRTLPSAGPGGHPSAGEEGSVFARRGPQASAHICRHPGFRIRGDASGMRSGADFYRFAITRTNPLVDGPLTRCHPRSGGEPGRIRGPHDIRTCCECNHPRLGGDRS